MIPGFNRFHGHNSLRYVYMNGKAVRSRLFTLKSVPNTRRTRSRAAVVVSKKVIKSAIGRNRIRRRVYEYVRLHLPRISQSHDIVIIITSAEVATIPYPDLTAQLDQVFGQAGLF